jgi:hypothetical protein
MFCVIPGFISPIIVSYLTFENQTVESWKIVFLITSFILVISGTIYVIFSDSRRRDWNRGKIKTQKLIKTRDGEEIKLNEIKESNN